jgi:acyl-coenzyme A thioesterase PaaI-like protein
MSVPERIPEGYERHFRTSPLTDPWEPLYSKAENGSIILALRIRQAHCNSRGFAHGGLISALADNAMGLSLIETLGQRHQTERTRDHKSCARFSWVGEDRSMARIRAARAASWRQSRFRRLSRPRRRSADRPRQRDVSRFSNGGRLTKGDAALARRQRHCAQRRDQEYRGAATKRSHQL